MLKKLNPLSFTGDPKTKEFLRLSMDKVFGFPSFIRFGWSTAYTILNKEAIQCNFDEEDEDEEDENIPSVSNFFKKQASSEIKCNQFFTRHNLKRADNFN
jgi:ribonuclease H2 subunit A